MDEQGSEEEELARRQSLELHPVGRTLRSTFAPADGETLQPGMTRLMIELAHLDYERSAATPAPKARPSLLRRVIARLIHR